jgi:hypothetical protein
MTSVLQFQVPNERKDSAEWFVVQDPTRIADMLDFLLSGAELHSDAGLGQPTSTTDKELSVLRTEMQEREDRIESLQSRIAEYRKERSSFQQEYNSELHIKLELQQKIHNDQMMHMQASMQRMQELHETQLQHVKDGLAKDYEKHIDSLKQELSQMNTSLQQQLQEKATIHQNYVQKLEPMIEANKHALQSFGTRSTTRTGVIGENLVYDVFAGLNMGYLQDQRHSKDVGCEDYLWTNQGLVCSVEVKFAERLHSQHDMQKHVTRIQEASRSSKANCALFLSLKCPVPNTKEIDIKIISGIPVVYISGGGNKELTPHVVARLGFEIMNTTWSYLKTNMSEEINDVLASQMIDNVSEHFEKQLRVLVNVEKEVQNLTKQANSLLRTAEKLNKMRTDMVNDITSMQIRYPELDGTSNDSVDSREAGAGAEARPEVIELILNYNETHKRYPKSLRDLPAASAVDDLPKTIDFDLIIQQAKLECRKRKRAASAASS